MEVNKRGLPKRTAAKVADRMWLKVCNAVSEERSHRYSWNVRDQEDDEWLELFIIDNTDCCQISRNDLEPVWPTFHGFPSPLQRSDAHKTPD